MSMNNYVGDELANKVRHLHKALIQAEKIIEKLETENEQMRDTLSRMSLFVSKDTGEKHEQTLQV